MTKELEERLLQLEDDVNFLMEEWHQRHAKKMLKKELLDRAASGEDLAEDLARLTNQEAT